jgi:hypothetical protein
MVDMQNVDAGNKVDLERVIGLGVLTAGIGSIVGLLWKRHHIVTVIKYNDANGEQTIALDFLGNTQYAQPLIYKKMRDIQQQRKIESLENAVNQPTSIADELSKIAKLKELNGINSTNQEERKDVNMIVRGCRHSSKG